MVRYPILPRVTCIESRAARREILEIRHSSLYAPRDFDISPYFQVVKPTIESGFDYRAMHWVDLPRPRERLSGEIAPPIVPDAPIPIAPPQRPARPRRRRIAIS
jgi:hypothetical protein